MNLHPSSEAATWLRDRETFYRQQEQRVREHYDMDDPDNLRTAHMFAAEADAMREATRGLVRDELFIILTDLAQQLRAQGDLADLPAVRDPLLETALDRINRWVNPDGART